ncbi:MAG: hypothetical protein AAB582_00005, partial [Patescibacteria group bacterium]
MGKRLLLIALLALFIPQISQAQIGGAETLGVVVTPQYPRPYQTVSVRPESTLIDLAASQVTVSANGTVVSRGSGSTPVNVTVGAAGSLTTIRVTATSNGQTYSKEVRIRPAEVSL